MPEALPVGRSGVAKFKCTHTEYVRRVRAQSTIFSYSFLFVDLVFATTISTKPSCNRSTSNPIDGAVWSAFRMGCYASDSGEDEFAFCSDGNATQNSGKRKSFMFNFR